MLRQILGPDRHQPANENAPVAHSTDESLPRQVDARALATGAALAVAVDTSPAVLVSIYDYASRIRSRPRRAG